MVKIGLVLLGLMLSAEESSMIQQIADSGRCADVAEPPQSLIAPGPPPLLSFRYYEGKTHHRFGNNELMLDDAGH
ncbi:MAG TPA: hypothetical protein VFB14_05965 [Bryobacteraceae bacterium]|nr:hypothetical protein [Bryobacteraceae bacterium]